MNGVLQTTTGSNTETPASTNTNFTLGVAQGKTAQLFAGNLDEVGLWSRALTAAEIAYLAGGGRP